MSTLNVDNINEYTTDGKVNVGHDIKLASGKSVLDSDGNKTGAMVKLASTTASSDSSVIFDNFVDHTNYSYYHIVFNFIKLGTDNQNWQVTFRQGGASGSDITGTYRRYNNYADVSGSSLSTYTVTQSNATTFHVLGNSTREEYSGTVDFFPTNGTNGFSHMKSLATYKDAGGTIYATITTNLIDVATASTGLKFSAGSGTFDGTITIYGVAK